MTQPPSDTNDNAVIQKTFEIFAEADSFKAIEHLEALGEPVVVSNRYSQKVRQLYSKKKDVPATILFGRAGIHFALREAKRVANTDAKQSAKLKAIAKTIAYNVGANTWPGWDDEGIVINKTDLAAGLDLARLNLRLGQELNRSPEKIGNAHWLIAAHLLWVGREKQAVATFTQAEREFKTAKNKDYALMAAGYAALAKKAVAATRAEGDKQLKKCLETLRNQGSEDAKFFAEQIKTELL